MSENTVKVLDEYGKIEVVTLCPMCGEHHKLYVNLEDWHEYKYITDRRHIQDIFPYLKPEEREMLMTGICPRCFASMFPDEDGEEYETPEDKDWNDYRDEELAKEAEED